MHDQRSTPEQTPDQNQDQHRQMPDQPDKEVKPGTAPPPDDEGSLLDEAMPDVAVNNSVSSEHPGG